MSTNCVVALPYELLDRIAFLAEKRELRAFGLCNSVFNEIARPHLFDDLRPCNWFPARYLSLFNNPRLSPLVKHLTIRFNRRVPSTGGLPSSLVIDALRLLPNLASLFFSCDHHSLDLGSAALRSALAAHQSLREIRVDRYTTLEGVTPAADPRRWPAVARPQAVLRLGSPEEVVDAASVQELLAFARDANLIIEFLMFAPSSAESLALLPSLNIPVKRIELNLYGDHRDPGHPLLAPTMAWFQQLASLSPSIRTICVPDGWSWYAQHGGGTRAAGLAAFAPAHLFHVFDGSQALASSITLSDAAPRVVERLELVLPDDEVEPEDLGLLLRCLAQCFPALGSLSITGDVTTVIPPSLVLPLPFLQHLSLWIPAELVACPDMSRWILDAVAWFANDVYLDLLERAKRWRAYQLRSEEGWTRKEDEEVDGSASPEVEEDDDDSASLNADDDFRGGVEEALECVVNALEDTGLFRSDVTLLDAPPDVTDWPRLFPQLLFCHLPPAAQDLIGGLASHLAPSATLHISFMLDFELHALSFSVVRDRQTGGITIRDEPSDTGLDWFFVCWARSDPQSFIETFMTPAPSDSVLFETPASFTPAFTLDSFLRPPLASSSPAPIAPLPVGRPSRPVCPYSYPSPERVPTMLDRWLQTADA